MEIHQIPAMQGIPQKLASGQICKWEASRHSLTGMIIQQYQSILTEIHMSDRRHYK